MARSRMWLLLLLVQSLLLLTNPIAGATVAADDAVTVRVGVHENPPKTFTDCVIP